jgi:hypothetical protein
MNEVESQCRAFLQNAAARHRAMRATEPEEPSADYLSGFRGGYEAGYLAALALAVSMMGGESPGEIIEQAEAQVALDVAFPFTLDVEAA